MGMSLASGCSARIGLDPPGSYLSRSDAGLPRASVTASQLNVRARPSSRAAILETLPRGSFVELVSPSGGWLEVRTPSKTLGWVAARYVSGYDPSAVPFSAAP